MSAEFKLQAPEQKKKTLPVYKPRISSVFDIDGPTMLAVSFGRTSAFMLWHYLDAHNGELPEETYAVFTNTGREMEATLRFGRELSERWNVPIWWLERAPGPHEEWTMPEERFRVVDFSTASRDGEPFAQLIRERGHLPTSASKYCTEALKTRVSRDFMDALGHRYWTRAVGLRADERVRVSKIRATNGSERWDVECPLYDAGFSKHDVMSFFSTQPFDLELAGEWEGNCDGCFRKSRSKRRRMAEDHPHLIAWWAEMETMASATATTIGGGRWRLDGPTFAEMIADAEAIRRGDRPRLPFTQDEDDEDSIPCACTD